MKILWTKSDKILSVLIRKATKEPVSHCVIETHGMVIHSNLYGLHIEDALYFKKHCEVIFELELPPSDLDEAKLHATLSKYEGRMYDFGALLFAGAALVLRNYFKIPLPKSNLWQSTGMFLCTEWVSKYLDGKENSMITPYGLYLKLLASQSPSAK